VGSAAVLADLILPFLLFAAIRIQTKSVNVELDFDISHGTFYAFLSAYSKFFYFLAASGSIVAYRLAAYSRDGAVTLIVSSLLSLLFVAWITFRYEMYMHARYPRNGMIGGSNYTPNAYAVTLALGLSSLFLFCDGLVVVGLAYIGGAH